MQGFYTAAADTSDWIRAGAIVLIAFAIAELVDRALLRRGRTLTKAVGAGDLSPVAVTRLRLVRRLIFALIIVIGVAFAAAELPGVSRAATTLLASSAVLGLVIGFAARQTLANVVAGVMLAVTQPIRVGDWVTVENNYGVVEDVRLNYTVLRTGGEQRVLIPNEKLASSVLKNDTLKVEAVGVEVAVWIPAGADAAHAVRVLGAEGEVAIAETVPWGTRLQVAGATVPPPERGPGEAALRARCHARLREEGLLEGFGGPGRS
jgi:small-conductance mechanosensitive channel